MASNTLSVPFFIGGEHGVCLFINSLMVPLKLTVMLGRQLFSTPTV